MGIEELLCGIKHQQSCAESRQEATTMFLIEETKIDLSFKLSKLFSLSSCRPPKKLVVPFYLYGGWLIFNMFSSMAFSVAFKLSMVFKFSVGPPNNQRDGLLIEEEEGQWIL